MAHGFRDELTLGSCRTERQGPNGEITISARIITTEHNALMAGIHNHMPVILAKESRGLWTDPSALTREVQPVLMPYPADLMAAHPGQRRRCP
jgi:putative SOS response-associated peptidase YedK